jgi:hypothetical protein
MKISVIKLISFISYNIIKISTEKSSNKPSKRIQLWIFVKWAVLGEKVVALRFLLILKKNYRGFSI